MTKNLPKKKKKDKSLNKAQKKVKSLKSISNNKKKKIIRRLRFYRGPLPPVQVLQGYEHLYSKSAKIIFTNFKKQSNHRRHLENAHSYNHYALAYIALIGSIVIMLVFLYFSYSLLMHNHSIVGSIFGLTGILGIIGSMIKLINHLTSDNRKKK